MMFGESRSLRRKCEAGAYEVLIVNWKLGILFGDAWDMISTFGVKGVYGSDISIALDII